MNALPADRDAKRVLVSVERLEGLQINGWALDRDAPGQETLAFAIGAQALALPHQRVSRRDVNATLGVDPTVDLGFVAQLTLADWQRLTFDAHAALNVTANGSAHDSFCASAAAQRAVAVHANLEHAHGAIAGGWVLDSHEERADFAIQVDHLVLAMPVRRLQRLDVAHGFGAQEQQFGFVVEVPGIVWEGRVDESLQIRLLLNGHPLGQPWTIRRAQLLGALDDALAQTDPQARTGQALLYLEHLLHAQRVDVLGSGRIEALDAILHTQDLPPLGSRQPSAISADPSAVTPQRAPCTMRPVGRLGAWLEHPAHGRQALKALLWLKRWPLTQALAQRLEVSLTRAVGLFDAPFYAETVPAESHPGMPALAHYVREGDARGLAPMALFDPRHYTAQLPLRRHPGVNRLLHYALDGRWRGCSPSEWFNPLYYLRHNADVAAHGGDLLRHWLRHGWRENRKPHARFQPRLGFAPTVQQRLRGSTQVSHPDPRLAYLLDGHVDAFSQLPWRGQIALDVRDWLDRALWPAYPDRRQLRLEPDFAAPVCVVVPVYAGAQATLRCLNSVLAHADDARIVVVDDCSPEPALSAHLDWMAHQGWIDLLVNDANCGFVASVNRALNACTDADVVLLNADTRVHKGWLARLRAHARAQPRAASITPLSNNATIASYPLMPSGSAPAQDPDDATLDRLTAEVNAGVQVAAPSGVGFCMWMRRAAIDAIGGLDESAFGRGYGEENDWCQRAIAAGWVNLIAADVYVLHEGGVSFGSESAARTQAALVTLAQRYPGYESDVGRWIASDPLALARARLDAAVLRERCGARVTVMFDHGRGGGTERLEREEAARQRSLHSRGTLWVQPAQQAGQVRLRLPDQDTLPNLRRLAVGLRGDDHGPPDLWTVLGIFQIEEVQLHHLAGLPAGLPDWLAQTCAAQGIALRIFVHDYHLICPRINLVDDSGVFCGEPSTDRCNQCLKSNRAPGGVLRDATDIAQWRDDHLQYLRHASAICVPSDDVARRMHRYAGNLAWEVAAHDNAPALPADKPPQPIRHVLVLGAISAIKGLDVVARLASSAIARRAALQVSLLGYSSDDERLKSAGVALLGRYDDSDVMRRIEAARPDLIFIPSVWPETYCYTLSAAMAAGVRVAVFDLGAQADRLASWDPDRRWHRRWPLAWALNGDQLATAMLDWDAKQPARMGAEPVLPDLDHGH